MANTPADINRIIEALGELVDDFSRFWDDQGNPEPDNGNSPAVLIETMLNLLEILYNHETGDQELSSNELSKLGDYGLNLLDALEVDTQTIDYPSHQLFGDLAFPLALWLARNDSDIEELGPVVNALARMANRLTHPEELERLFIQSGEIIEAISPRVLQDLEQTEEGAPWSVLLLNRSIIATRTLKPELMEMAFSVLSENLPTAAPMFFTEAMEQMELLDYPPQVRAVVERYFNDWGDSKLLH